MLNMIKLKKEILELEKKYSFLKKLNLLKIISWFSTLQINLKKLNI